MDALDTVRANVISQGDSVSRILLVEDDIFIRRMNVDTLHRHGFAVDAAEDGVQAWEILQTNRYDLMVTDNNIPNLCGIDLIKKMRTAGMNLPVIIASGMNQKELQSESSLRLAATLPKPYTNKELLNLVQCLLSPTPVCAGCAGILSKSQAVLPQIAVHNPPNLRIAPRTISCELT